MQITNSGSVEIVGDLTVSEKMRIVGKAFEEFGEHVGTDMSDSIWFDYDDDEVYVCFSDTPGSDLDLLLENVAKKIKPDGLYLAGEVSYYGDYDGFIIVGKNEVKAYDQGYEMLIKGDDYTLIEELEKRGYTVTKKQESPVNAEQKR